MTSRSLARIMLGRWRVTITGVILALVVSGLALAFVPLQYSASGTLVVIAPRQPGNSSLSNPLLKFDASLNTTSMILVQSLGSTYTPLMLGVDPKTESIDVKNSGSLSLKEGGLDRPFISITAKSLSPERSVALVAAVMDLAGDSLRAQQVQMHVLKRNSLALESVVDAAPSKASWANRLKYMGSGIALCLTLTVAAACWVERKASRTGPQPMGGSVVISRILGGPVVDPTTAVATWESSDPELLVTKLEAAGDVHKVNGENPARLSRS